MIQYDVILQLLKDVCVLTKHLKLGGAGGGEDLEGCREEGI